MKTLSRYISAVFLVGILITSCGDKKESTKEKPTADKNTNTSDNTNELLAGTESKTWYITKQRDALGDKDKVTKEEKNETLNLYKDGKFSITDARGTAAGTWSTEGSHTLEMHFEGKDVTENFAIMDISKEKVVLQAADGSEMTLQEK